MIYAILIPLIAMNFLTWFMIAKLRDEMDSHAYQIVKHIKK